MGVIQRQAAKRSIANYVLAVIGICSQLWIYPLVYGIKGNVDAIVSMVALLLPFASFGISGLTVRFFPKFRNKNRSNNGFLGLLLLTSTIAFGLFVILFFFFEDSFYDLLEFLKADIPFFRSYSNIIIGCVLLAIYNGIMASYASNLNRVVVPFIITNLTFKLLIPIIYLLHFKYEFKVRLVYESLFWIYLAMSILHTIYLHKIGGLNIKPTFMKVLRKEWKSMSYYASYGIIASIGSILAFRLDVIMLRNWTNDVSTGIYGSMMVLAGMVIYPYSSISSISGPQIATAWKDNNMSNIKMLYQKASNVLILPTLFVGLLLVLNFYDVTWISSNPEEMQLGLSALFVLVLARSIDSVFGLNGTIIALSKYYYFNFLATLVLAFTTVYLNYLFIYVLKYGMLGAALGTCIAFASFNLMKFVFIWIVWKMQPFRLQSLWILLILGLGAYIAYTISFEFHPIINIILRSLLFTILTIPLIYYTNLSPELNKFTLDVWNKGVNITRKWRN